MEGKVLSLEFLRGEDTYIDEIIDKYNKGLIEYEEGLELISDTNWWINIEDEIFRTIEENRK